jgi:hypothetical protein
VSADLVDKGAIALLRLINNGVGALFRSIVRWSVDDEKIGRFFTQGGGGFDSEGITIEGGREKKEEKRGRGGEKEHLSFISIASFATSL